MHTAEIQSFEILSVGPILLVGHSVGKHSAGIDTVLFMASHFRVVHRRFEKHICNWDRFQRSLPILYLNYFHSLLSGALIFTRCDTWCTLCIEQPIYINHIISPSVATTSRHMPTLRLPRAAKGTLIATRVHGHCR